MKKAFAWLDARKIAYEFHDYKKDGVPPGKLKAWAAKVGWEELANTRGPTWRKIPDAEKRNLSASAVIELLEENSSAIKRPVIEADGELLVGFDPDEYAKAF
jgi:arsenate reductase